MEPLPVAETDLQGGEWEMLDREAQAATVGWAGSPRPGLGEGSPCRGLPRRPKRRVFLGS